METREQPRLRKRDELKVGLSFAKETLNSLFGGPCSLGTAHRWPRFRLSRFEEQISPELKPRLERARLRLLKLPADLKEVFKLTQADLWGNSSSSENLLAHLESLAKLTERFNPNYDSESSLCEMNYIYTHQSKVGSVPVMGTFAFEIESQVSNFHILGCLNTGGYPEARFLAKPSERRGRERQRLLKRGGIGRPSRAEFLLIGIIEGGEKGQRELGGMRVDLLTSRRLFKGEAAVLPKEHLPAITLNSPSYRDLPVEKLELLVFPNAVSSFGKR